MPKRDLFVIGELNVDLILNAIQGFPEIGKEIVAGSSDLALGSSSAILAANSVAIGAKTAFCGFVGDDMYGDFVLQQLRQKGVDVGFVRKAKGEQTGLTVVMNYGQDRANVTYCGAMELLGKQDIPWSGLKNYRHLHVSSIFLQKNLKADMVEIFKKAKEYGLTTSLDPQWDPEEKWDFDYGACLPYVDIFMPNRQELQALAGTSDLEEGIVKLSAFSNCLVVKMGQEGSIGVHGDQKIQVPAYKNPEHVDSIGAGDSFNAGFLKKYLENATLQECLDHGNLMGALNTTAAGGTEAFSNGKIISEKIKLILKHTLEHK